MGSVTSGLASPSLGFLTWELEMWFMGLCVSEMVYYPGSGGLCLIQSHSFFCLASVYRSVRLCGTQGQRKDLGLL